MRLDGRGNLRIEVKDAVVAQAVADGDWFFGVRLTFPGTGIRAQYFLAGGTDGDYGAMLGRIHGCARG